MKATGDPAHSKRHLRIGYVLLIALLLLGGLGCASMMDSAFDSMIDDIGHEPKRPTNFQRAVIEEREKEKRAFDADWSLRNPKAKRTQ